MSKHWFNLRFIHLGLSFGINFTLLGILGGWAGKQLDSRLESEPWFLIIGLTGGVLLAFYALIKEILAIDKLKDNKGVKEEREHKD